MACSAVVVSTYIGINANKGDIGDITLAELINTPEANARCVEISESWDPNRVEGRCSLNDVCYLNPAWSDNKCVYGY